MDPPVPQTLIPLFLSRVLLILIIPHQTFLKILHRSPLYLILITPSLKTTPTNTPTIFP